MTDSVPCIALPAGQPLAEPGVLISISGKVQGVGFRPFVWQLAGQLQLRGDCSNNSAGVEIQLAASDGIDEFLSRLQQQAPALAKIDSISLTPFSWLRSPVDFIILSSRPGRMNTQIVPDAATCPDCLDELFNPGNRRFAYPFINCTHCGPRYTIISAMPYDRPNTSMATFPLCPACGQEYASPTDRRFHAQPVACPVCGPVLSSCQADGVTQHVGQMALEQAAAAIAAGHIVAIKGLGGFHLACDATRSEAVRRLRKRKHRPGKPLAVMLPDSHWLARVTNSPQLDPLAALLASPAAPIVLVNHRSDSPLCPEIAPQLDEVGVMLPANPLQHLLMRRLGCPLVMTSGNASGRAPALSNQQALAGLAGIADLWLLHDRAIVQRADDSLQRWHPDHPEMLRRARGYVPDAFPLPPGFSTRQPLLATGGDRKNTFCLLLGNKAILSQHFGDLEAEDVQQQWHQAIAVFSDLYHVRPELLATDAHPGYVCHRWAHRQSLPVVDIMHHHAHLAACLAEHQWPLDAGPVIGLALDGIGYGPDGQWWGGECLLVDYRHCRHLGGLPPVALPGGDLAARQPWRNLLAHLDRFVPDWQGMPQSADLLARPWQPLLKAVQAGINAPLASSCGRLFDAAAALLGCAPEQQHWEGEAACRLEALAHRSAAADHPVTLPLKGDRLDLAVFWRQWLLWQAPAPERAWAFHDALAKGFARLARQFADRHGIRWVAVSGGVLHNRLLRQRLCLHLAPLRVMLPEQVPAGDGGLALGQAMIACALRIPQPIIQLSYT